MARRPTKLPVYEHRVVCPYCKSDIVVSSIMEHIIVARRNCPACKFEMLIEDDQAIRVEAARIKTNDLN